MLRHMGAGQGSLTDSGSPQQRAAWQARPTVTQLFQVQDRLRFMDFHIHGMKNIPGYSLRHCHVSLTEFFIAFISSSKYVHTEQNPRYRVLTKSGMYSDRSIWPCILPFPFLG